MRRKKVTEEYLEKEVWWWREGSAKHPIDLKPGPLLPKYYLAFDYELARRVRRTRRLAPFPTLAE